MPYYDSIHDKNVEIHIKSKRINSKVVDTSPIIEEEKDDGYHYTHKGIGEIALFLIFYSVNLSSRV